MNTVEINPKLFTWARERSGIDLSSLTRITPKYPKWESGEANPTWKQLETFARKTYTPLGYFFLPAPPIETLPIPDFRTLKDEKLSTPSPNLLDTIQSMQRRQNWLSEFLIEEEVEALSFIGSATMKQKHKTVADSIREVLNLPNDWANEAKRWEDAITIFRDVLASSRIMLTINGVVGNSTNRKLDVEEFRGFALCDSYAPLIFVNGTDTKSAQMFTVAHELAHLWLGKGGLSGFEELTPNDNKVEQYCNNVAAEFLVPKEELLRHWAKAKNLKDPFSSISRRFKVSPIMAARRVLDLEFIKKAEYFRFYREYTEQERYKNANKASGGNFYKSQNNRVGEYFFLEVARAAKSGSLPYRDAYNLTGLRGRSFDRYYNELGVDI